MEPIFGEQYKIFIPGRPVPKSTTPPPNVRRYTSQSQRLSIQAAIIGADDKYKGLRATREYQKYISQIVGYRYDFPQFNKQDPIKLTFLFYKEKHERGDLKNLIAAVEDGIQLSGRIHDDGQVTSYGEPQIHYYSKRPGVLLTAEIDPLAADYEWLKGHLHNVKKHTDAYIQLRNIPIGGQ